MNCGIEHFADNQWREGWDFDPTCMSPGQPTSEDPSPSSSYGRSSPSARTSKLNYCEGQSITLYQVHQLTRPEALPFYWLAQALLNLLQAAPPNEPGWNSFSGIKYRDMLKSSRTFTRMGEGVDTANGSSANGPSMGDLSSLFNDSPAAWENLGF